MSEKERKDLRVTVSLSPTAYAELLELAQKNDVSIAWIMRYAVTDLLDRYRDSPQRKLPLSFQRSAE